MGRQDSLCEYVATLSGIASGGGRIHLVGNGTCVLSDIPVWTEDMARCVKDRFPCVYISVRSTNQSLTGFCVVMEMHTEAFKCVRPMLLFALVLGLTILVWWMVWHLPERE